MSAAKKNVLLIFTDMQRADTIHALGNPVIKTPNLDRLVNEGTAFVSAYSPSPVCVPARCSMHYGLYPTKTGATDNGRMMDDNGKSLPTLLRQAGYRTRAVGKCHFTPDPAALRGFDDRRTQEECTSVGDGDRDDYVKFLEENGYDSYEPHGARGEMYYIPQVSCLPAEAHPCQWIADESIDYMKECNDSDQPWMLMSSFIHPHPPFAPPKPWHKLYRGPDMPLPFVPDQPEALHTFANRRQNRYKFRDQGIDRNLLRQIKAYYYATISFIDYQVGRMLDALEAMGTLDDTLILFTSDHGEFLGDYNCFGKRTMHDPSSRVPMIARLPGTFEAGKVCDEVVNLVDVLPTCLSAAGADLSGATTDGEDMAAVARGEASHDFVFSQCGDHGVAQYMAVTKEWKYFYSVADRKEFLFDRVKDPSESRNRANLPTTRGDLKEMRTMLMEFLKSENSPAVDIGPDGGVKWREYPPVDDSFLADPDARLLFQDNPAGPPDLPGYAG